MRAQSIVVLGGTGLLGTRLVARLIKDGHQVTVLSRDREQHKHLLVLPGLTLKNCDVYDEAQLSEHFRGKDVVINLVGILNERGFGGAGFRRAHTELTQCVLLAARSPGGPPPPQGFPPKTPRRPPSYYLRSKGEAERLIRESSATLDWTILKPSVMFGPGDSFLNRFAGLLAAVPLIFPLAKPNARFQPVLVDDVIEAFAPVKPMSSAARRSIPCVKSWAWWPNSRVSAAGSSAYRMPWRACRRWRWTSCPDGRSP